MTILWLLLFLLGSAYYSGIETGIVSVNRVRLRHRLKGRDRRARELQWFIENPDRMLSSTLIGTNICNTAFTILGTNLIVGWTGHPALGNALAAVSLLLIILVFGEYLPKAWFQSHALDRSIRHIDPLRLSAFLFQGVSLPLTALLRLLLPAPRDTDPEAARNRVTRKDIRFLLSRESGATPDLGEQRRRMVEGVFLLSEKTAREVMLPRSGMKVIRNDTPMADILELAGSTRAKSFPVYSDSDRRFTGILKLSDLYAHIDDPDLHLPRLLRPPQYVAADTPADDLLPRLRLTRQPMLLVRDEQDQVIGFVTTEVVLEEIIGPLYER